MAVGQVSAEALQEISRQNKMIGERIRRLRKKKGMTLSDMSPLVGLSVGYLSQIERGISSPTVKALFEISHSLGVNVGWFLSQSELSGDLEIESYVVRRDRRREISYSYGITDVLLNTDDISHISMMMSVIEPGAGVLEDYSHEGEEVGFLLEGELEIWIGKERFDLHEGDSFSFPSTILHRYRNPGGKSAKIIWCVSPQTY